MIRFLFIALLLIFRFFLSNSQSLKKEQKITIDQFINKLNNSDTTIDNYLIDYNELSQYFIHKDCYFSKYVLEKIYNDRKFLKTFDKCVWECRFSGKTRSVLSSEDKRWIHEMDSIKVSQVQEKMIKKNYKFDKDNPYQAIFDYNVSLLLVTDTCRWRQFIESIICDDELLGDADYIISFFNLPSSYKWIVGRFKKYQANNQNVKLLKLENEGIFDRNGYNFTKPILTLVNERGELIRLKLLLIYINGKWKLFRELEFK